MRALSILYCIILVSMLLFTPVLMCAEIYHYIDVDGVERYSNIPPPPGAAIIDTDKEIKYDEGSDRAQQEKNSKAAADYIEENTPPEVIGGQKSSSQPPSSQGNTNVYIYEDDDEVDHHRRRQRREHIHREQPGAEKQHKSN